MTQKRGLVFRIFIVLAVFIYVGYESRQVLPGFDLTIMLAFFIYYLLWMLFFENVIYREPDEPVIKNDDKRSYIYMQLTFIIGLLFATIDFIGLHYTRLISLEPGIIYAGLGLFTIACLVRYWGLKSLGPYFNRRVAVYENHRLITSGAYKYIRHPIYLGVLLSYIAIPMIFNSWGAWLIMLFTAVPALIYRINVEEGMLIRHFGASYQDYMMKTKKLIPGWW